MNETQAPNNAPLYLKLATIMGEVGNIPKTGENAFFRYKFVTADAVADRVRDLLSLHKVAFFAAIVDRELIEVRKIEKNGEIKPMPRWVVTFEFTFADGESGATVTQRWVAEADSTDDKGINKCATAAQKYFLLKTFVVTSADEPDADAGKVTGNAKTPAARAQRPASASNSSGTPSTSNSAQNAPQRPKSTPQQQEQEPPDPFAEFAPQPGANASDARLTDDAPPNQYRVTMIKVVPSGNSHLYLMKSGDTNLTLFGGDKFREIGIKPDYWKENPGIWHSVKPALVVEADLNGSGDKAKWEIHSITQEAQ